MNPPNYAPRIKIADDQLARIFGDPRPNLYAPSGPARPREGDDAPLRLPVITWPARILTAAVMLGCVWLIVSGAL